MNALEATDAEQKLTVLRHQNKQLAEQLKSQQAKIRELEDAAAKFDEAKQTYGETLLCVNRLWSQLSADVADMAQRATGEPLNASYFIAHLERRYGA